MNAHVHTTNPHSPFTRTRVPTGVVVLKGAAPPHIEPERFPNLVKRLVRLFNPGDGKQHLTTWRDQNTNPWERYKAETSPAGTFQLPSCPEVLVIGKGQLEDHHGLTCTLGGKRAAYGSAAGSQVIGNWMHPPSQAYAHTHG